MTRKKKDEAPRPTPQQRRVAETRLRKGGRNCPVCLAILPSLGGRPSLRCAACRAELLRDRRCAKCHEPSVWASGVDAGCAACGYHGSRVRVIAGQAWLTDPDTGLG